jgi:ribosomal protein S18 acetylase RimI-like enzyme
MRTSYSEFAETDEAEIRTLIKSLYSEDPDGEMVSEEKIGRTITFLMSHPENGTILIFTMEEVVVGYTILINYWSNEYGGIVLHIDELYIKNEFRGKSIGTDFINELINSRYNNCKALVTEATPGNTRAFNLYKKLGFKPSDNELLRYIVND